MKKTAIALVIASTSMFTAVNAQANGTYFELGYSQYMETDSGISISIPMLVGTIGYRITDFISLEGFLGSGISKDTIKGSDIDPRLSGINADVKVENLFGANLKGSYSFSDNLIGFAKLGFASTEVKVSIDGFGSETVTDTGVLIGAGIEYNFTESVYGTTSYTRYNSDGGSANIGLGVKF